MQLHRSCPSTQLPTPHPPRTVCSFAVTSTSLPSRRAVTPPPLPLSPLPLPTPVCFVTAFPERDHLTMSCSSFCLFDSFMLACIAVFTGSSANRCPTPRHLLPLPAAPHVPRCSAKVCSKGRRLPPPVASPSLLFSTSHRSSTFQGTHTHTYRRPDPDLCAFAEPAHARRPAHCPSPQYTHLHPSAHTRPPQ